MNINDLARISMGQEKNKSMAFNTILKIIEQSDSIENVDVEEYKNLYAFFSKTLEPTKDKWDWINSFCSTHADREYIRNPWVDDQYIYATNGHILVRSVNDLSLDPGIYDRNKIKIENIGQMPNINSVLAKYNFSGCQLLTDELIERTYLKGQKVCQGYYFDTINEKIFDKKLYDTATAYTGLVNKKYYAGHNTPLVIGTPELCVAILPTICDRSE